MLPVIVIIDDDKDILAYTSELLRKEGYAVKTAATGAAGIAIVQKAKPDLVLLDIHLPDISGESLCVEIKKKDAEIPVIMFTAQDSVDMRVKGFSNGADDYIAKPFAPAELIARIKARLRGVLNSENSPITVGDLVLDPARVSVSRAGKPIEVTANEFKLLQYLMSNVGIVLTRDMILNHVWRYSPDIETRVVDVYVGYLRKKIDGTHKKKLLHSIRGFGYTIKG